MSFIEVRIIAVREGSITVESREEFERLSVPAGEVGEICVCGDHVLRDYLGNGAAWNESKIRVDDMVWHRTGDAGYLDHHGYLYLAGRLRQSFVHNGQRTMVFPIEQKLLDIDGISLGTILSIDDRVVIVVEPAMRGAMLNEISSRIRQQGIVHDQVIAVAMIPRDPRHHSKIDYDRLRERVERRMKRG